MNDDMTVEDAHRLVAEVKRGMIDQWTYQFAMAERMRRDEAIKQAQATPGNLNKTWAELGKDLDDWILAQGYGTYTECLIAKRVEPILAEFEAQPLAGYPIRYSVVLPTCGRAPAMVD